MAQRVFLAIVTLLGIVVLGFGVATSSFEHWPLMLLYAGLGALSGVLRLRQVAGIMSFGIVFALLGLVELSLGEAMIVGCAVTLAQFLLPRREASVPGPLPFHIANTTIAIELGYFVFHGGWSSHGAGSPVSLAVAASLLFVWNVIPAAMVLSFAHQLSVGTAWRECVSRTFPHYLAGGFLALLIHGAGHGSLWLAFPVVLMAYAIYLAERPPAKPKASAAEVITPLHLRTIESLALAIEARDLTSNDHLRRLEVYCCAIGEELGLTPDEIQALRIAALLHDIGKLAVPENILAKTGRLTKEEFEKVKIHPEVGADILDRVKFPFPVSSIVRSHHERWNGGGYPRGLKADEIPTGARILGAVDALDSLMTEKPYRPALTIEQAIDRLAAEAGLTFDPRVIECIRNRYPQLEEQVASAVAADYSQQLVRLRDAFAPAAVKRASSDGSPVDKPAFLQHIAQSRDEAQLLTEMAQELTKSLQLDETLPAMVKKLERIIPFDSVVIYLINENQLSPRYATGESTSLFLSRQLTVGQGVAGWVALNGKPILNGRLSVESTVSAGHNRPLAKPAHALAVPLTSAGETVGVLLLVRRGSEQFTADHMRIVSAVQTPLSTAIQNAVKYEKATASASTDFLTGLPNARSLHLQLEAELARSRRSGTQVSVLVTDLDGFKDVNDRFGHLEGNNLLRAVAKTLRDNCREYDYVARMGGDEFVFVLPGLAARDVEVKIAQLGRAVVDSARVTVPDARVGLSVGQARFPDDGATAEELLLEADQRMYKAKTERKLRQHRGVPRGYAFEGENLHVHTTEKD